jgi:hypothetical protein
MTENENLPVSVWAIFSLFGYKFLIKWTGCRTQSGISTAKAYKPNTTDSGARVQFLALDSNTANPKSKRTF